MSAGAGAFGWLQDQGEDALLLRAVQDAFAGASAVGVAVSGGSDSLALLHLMARVAPHGGWRVEAVTVDHRLRPEAAAEAAFAGRACAALGVPHRTVCWDHGEIKGNLMDQARQARYRLIAAWAQSRGLGHVALGHTADDRAETLLMGLARRAGLDGLSGMRGVWRQDGIMWSRPLLAVRRGALRDCLRRHGIGWVDDPTNDDAGYARIRARRALAALAPLGVSAAGLAAVAGHLDHARSALDWAVRRETARIVTEQAGALSVDRSGLLALPSEIRRRVLLACLHWLSGAGYPPRETGLDRVQAAILQTGKVTLAGCRILADKGTVWLVREPRAVRGASPVGAVWDGRWMVEGPPGEVRALGTVGLPRVKDWRTLGIPRGVLLVSPAVWQGDTLLAAPVAGLESGWKARIVAPFGCFPVSD